VALALDALVPAAKYGGSLTANTEEAYTALTWEDEREKPTWDALQTVTIEPPLPQQLNAIFETLNEDTQADLATLKTAVKLELEQGRAGIAKRIIQRANIPAELEPLRTAMLDKF
jgi:hypothetical protein